MSNQEINQSFTALRIFVEECDQLRALPAWKKKNAKAIALQRLDKLQDKMLDMAKHKETKACGTSG